MPRHCQSEPEFYPLACWRNRRYAESQLGLVSPQRGENGCDRLPEAEKAEEASRGENRSSVGASVRRFSYVRASRSSGSSGSRPLRISRREIGGRARRSTIREIGLPSSLCWCPCQASLSSWPGRSGIQVGSSLCFLPPPLDETQASIGKWDKRF